MNAPREKAAPEGRPSVEHTRPRPGPSAPVITALDARGEFLEGDQRALVSHVVHGGWGADIVFAEAWLLAH